MWDRVLAVHGSHLSHASVDVDSGTWLTAEDYQPSQDSRGAAPAADRRRPAGASWYQRARTGGLVQLDLTQPEQLELLRRYGPFTTDASVWVHGDPTPVIETGDSFGDLPPLHLPAGPSRARTCPSPSLRGRPDQFHPCPPPTTRDQNLAAPSRR